MSQIPCTLPPLHYSIPAVQGRVCDPYFHLGDIQSEGVRAEDGEGDDDDDDDDCIHLICEGPFLYF